MDSTGTNVELPILELRKGDGVMRNVAVVVMDLSKGMSLSAAEWTLHNHVKTGDSLIVLGVIKSSTLHPLKESLWFAKDESNAKANGTLDLDEAIWNKAAFEEKTTSFQSSCKKKGVVLAIRLKVGAFKSVVVDEVTASHATFLVFDRNLKLKKGNYKFFQDKISCKIYQVKNDQEADVIHTGERCLDTESGLLQVPSPGKNLQSVFTSTSSEAESDYFDINFEDSISQVSSVNGSIEDRQSVSQTESLIDPVVSPGFNLSSELLRLDSPSEGFTKTHRGFQSVKSSLIVSPRLLARVSSVQSTSIPHSKENLTEDIDSIYVQPGIRRPDEHYLSQNQRELNYQHDRQQEMPRNGSNGSLDILYQSVQDHGSAKDSIKKHIVDWKSAVVFENLKHHQKTELQKHHRASEVLSHQQFASRSTKQNSSDWCLLSSHGFSQWRPFLCSVCEQKSPQLIDFRRRFSYAELEAATDNFSEANFLAEGGFGFVYRGCLNGQAIAVKQHKLASTQGYKEFRTEVEVLSCAQHRNLVMLLGYCDENGHRMLVYEYVCNKSLAWHLSLKSPKPLEWTARHKVAVGAARALRYLHEECRVGCVVHRDMRPNNILLTHEFEPMVGDFGLARSHLEGQQGVETRIIGSFGYVAPEYAETGQVSWRADVYAFGVVLLELITGRKAIDLLRPPGQQSLTEWARPRLLNDAMFPDLVDPRLKESYDASEMRAMIRAAYHCIKKDPLTRPRMNQVLHILEGADKETDDVPRSSMDLHPSPIGRVSDFHSPQSQSVGFIQRAFPQRNRNRKPQSAKKDTGKAKLSYSSMV